MGLIVSTIQSIAQALHDATSPDQSIFRPHQPALPAPGDNNNRNSNRRNGNKTKDDNKTAQYPLLLVPGIAGTVLHVK